MTANRVLAFYVATMIALQIPASMLLFRWSPNPLSAWSEARVEERNVQIATEEQRPTQVACFFLTTSKRLDEIRAVQEGWAKNCWKVVIFSDQSAPGGVVNMADIIHNDYKDDHTFFQPGNETRDLLSLKSWHAWRYMAQRYLNAENSSVDFVMKADGDTFVIWDNYIKYITEEFRPDCQAYIGRAYRTREGPFVTGGTVTLSRQTLRFLNAELLKDELASPCGRNLWKARKAEDVALANCLGRLGIYPAFTRDSENRELFMNHNPNDHANTTEEKTESFLRDYQSYSFTSFYQATSPRACSFHYVPQEKQKDSLFYNAEEKIWQWSSGW